MFPRKLKVFRRTEAGIAEPVPLLWLDSFAMRNFTNAAVFDDTLPVAAGLLEAGYRVPLPALAEAMEAWFRRKGWLSPAEQLAIEELVGSTGAALADE